jgi:UPF0716 protein FxsA
MGSRTPNVKGIMALFLFLAFLAVPIIEITVIIKVGGVIGAWPTVGLILLTAMLGTAMVRAQGFQLLARANDSLARNRFPAEELFDGVNLLVAGLLLLTPGFVTDALGLVLLVPPWRRRIAGWVWRATLRAHNVHVAGGAGTWHRRDDGVIEGEYTEIPPTRLGGRRDDDPPAAR